MLLLYQCQGMVQKELVEDSGDADNFIVAVVCVSVDRLSPDS